MKKYKVYVIIERLEDGEYEEETDYAVPLCTFTDIKSASKLVDRIVDCVTDDGEVVFVPPLKGEKKV